MYPYYSDYSILDYLLYYLKDPYVLGFIILIFIFKLYSKKNQKNGPTLALRKFSIDYNEQNNKFLIQIIGRKPGLISWILSMLKIEDETSLIADSRQISYKSSGLYGTSYNNVSLASVASLNCGYLKNISFLLVGIFILLLGLYLTYQIGHITNIFYGSIIIAIICYVFYIFSKKLYLFVETCGGLIFGLTFKRSVIENVDVDIKKVQGIITIINNEILNVQIK